MRRVLLALLVALAACGVGMAVMTWLQLRGLA